MATNVDVPALGESVSEATIVKWHKNDGDTVAASEPLCELETDKANVDVPAPTAGRLKRLKNEGETVKIGDTIARIDENGAARAASPPASGSPAAEGSRAAGSVRERSAPAPPAPKSTPRPPATKPEDLRPSVRRIVEEKNLDASKIQGTARGGQITKEDAQRAASEQQQEVEAPASVSSGDGVRRVPMTRIRKRIGQNLVAAKQTTALLHTFNEVDLSAVQDLRSRFKERFEKIHGVGLGLMSFFCRAVVLALKEFPNVNAFIDGDDLVYHDYVNLGIAVSTERGLVVPVLKHVEQMSFAKIEAEIKRVAASARDGKLSLEDLSGGTFTITNGGVFGSLMSTPILLPPQSGILGMHAIKKRPVAVDDQVVVRPMMYLALGYDHRVVDGRESVSFLVRVKEYLEDPARLMLEI
jgi:2-oxoglutarate dehydrogenase E2 component (dihydrolipoamide succinyltransferase)